MKRILSILLAALCVLPLFVACQKGPTVTVVREGVCTLIYDSELVSDEAAAELAAAIESATGATVTTKSSISFTTSVRAEAGTIIVGNVITSQTKDLLSALRQNDLLLTVAGDLFLIGGKTESTVSRAITHFKERLAEIAKVGEDLTLGEDDCFFDAASYSVDELKIGGLDVHTYEIVLTRKPNINEQRFAHFLQQAILQKSGYLLPIVNESELIGAEQIRIGGACKNTSATDPHTYKMSQSGTTLELTAESFYAYDKLLTEFAGQFLSQKTLLFTAQSTLAGDALAAASATVRAGDVRLMFNNIWGSSSGALQRSKTLLEIYREYLPDVLGLQECSPDMRNSGLCDWLYDLGYREIPLPPSFIPYKQESETRDPIFYRTDVLELIHYGYQNLAVISELNEILDGLSGSKLESAKTALKAARADGSKSVNWAIFKVKATGELFMAASVHLWWKGGTYHDKIRVVQMREMRELLTKEAQAYLDSAGIDGTLPIFIGGDYNSRTERPSYKTMSEGPTPFTNLDVLAKENEKIDCDSHHTYPVYNKETKLWESAVAIGHGSYDTAIDHIYANNDAVDAGAFEMNRVAVVKDLYAYLSSDHNALWADISFTANTPKIPT